MKNCLSIEQSAELIKRGVSERRATSSVWSPSENAYIHPTFTLADLLSISPKEITVTMEFYDVDRLACLHISSTNEKWYVSYKYEFEEREYWCKMFNSEELIDALYKLLLWAIDHNHVKLE